MASTIADLVVRLSSDLSGFNMSKARSEMTATEGHFKRSTAKMAADMKDLGGKMSLGISLPVAIGLGFSVKAASSLNEQVNKTKVVFGDASAAMLKFTQDAPTQFGMSERAALQAAGSYGAVLKASGLTAAGAEKMSESLLTMSADMSSFNDIPTDVALEKIRAGLVGESEPLRQVGILLSEAAVQQEAYRSGIAKTGAVLTEGQKVQARYNLIQKQMNVTGQTGDWQRTSGSLANSMKTLTGSLEDLAASLGEVLIPVVTPVVKLLTGVSGVVADLPGPLRVAVVGFGLLAASIGPVLWLAGSFIENFQRVKGVLDGLGGTRVAFGGLRAGMGRIVTAIPDFVSGFKDARAAASAFSGPMGTLGGKTRGFATAVGGAINAGAQWIKAIPGIIAGNIALTATYAALSLAAAGAGLAIYGAIDAYLQWQDAIKGADQATKDANATNESNYRSGKITKSQYEENKANIEKDRYKAPWWMQSPLSILPGMPKFASGGYVPARPGGTPVIVGEGDEGEYIIPASKVKRASGGGGSAPTIHVHIGSVVGTDERAVRQLAEMVGRHLSRGVMRQMVGQNA